MTGGPTAGTAGAERFVVVVEVYDAGANLHHVITEAQHAAWRSGDGTSGQDREAYSDDQDREGYTVEEGSEGGDLLDLARSEGREFDTWPQAAAHVASLGGLIVDVIAAREDDG
jgi:hypothetical protein